MVGKDFDLTGRILSPNFIVPLSIKTGDPVRYQMKLVFPTVANETVNGVTYQKVIRSCLFDGTFVLPSDSSLQERKDFVAYIGNNITGTASGKIGYQIINQDSVV